MFILSGNRVKGRCGRETKLKDRNGETLFVGDIVALFHKDNLNCDKFQGLTAVVDDEYTSYSDGYIAVTNRNPQAFIMGIASEDIMSEKSEWSVERVKSYTRVINNENWYNYGFTYKSNI